MRLIKVLCAAALVAAVVAPGASAFRFSDHTRLMPVGAVGKPFSHPVETVAGCKGVYVMVHGGLPPGLHLVGDKRDDVDGSNWRIVGTPSASGSFSFWLIARNLCPVDSTEEDFTIRIAGPALPSLSIRTPALPVALVGAPYAARLSAAGGGTQRWSIALGALPAGLRLTADGRITGTAATTARSATVVLRVSDGGGRQATRLFAVTVRSRVAITTRRLAALRRGRHYALRLRTSGGAPITRGGAAVMRWKIVRGRLPVGLRLNTLNGTLIGRPRHAGSFGITVRVTDRLGSVAKRALVVRVRS
jgi:hypothetical protein